MGRGGGGVWFRTCLIFWAWSPGCRIPGARCLCSGRMAAAWAVLLCTVLTRVCFHALSPPLCISCDRTSLASLPFFLFFFFFPSRVAWKLSKWLAFTNLHLVICCTGLWESQGGGGGALQKNQKRIKINYFDMDFVADLFVPASSNMGWCLQSFHTGTGISLLLRGAMQQ